MERQYYEQVVLQEMAAHALAAEIMRAQESGLCTVSQNGEVVLSQDVMNMMGRM